MSSVNSELSHTKSVHVSDSFHGELSELKNTRVHRVPRSLCTWHCILDYEDRNCQNVAFTVNNRGPEPFGRQQESWLESLGPLWLPPSSLPFCHFSALWLNVYRLHRMT